MSAMKKKVQFSVKTGNPVERPDEQLMELPLSLRDNEGKVNKGQKSNFSNSLETRYKNSSPPVFLNDLPSGWKAECVITEGMFLINTSPLGSQKTMGEYARFLITRFVMPQFHRGTAQVHVIFDNPGHLPNMPKFFEQTRRDSTAKLSIDHTCDDLASCTKVSQTKWRENLLNCRQCKRRLVKFIGN